MSRYDDDSDFSAGFSEDDGGSFYDSSYGARHKHRPRHEPSRRPKNHYSNTSLEGLGEPTLVRSRTHKSDTDYNDSNALTLRGDRSLSTTGPGRFGGASIQRRRTSVDGADDYYGEQFSPRGESSRWSSNRINHQNPAPSLHVYGDNPTFNITNIYHHEPNTAPALGRAFTSSDSDHVPSRRMKGKSAADWEDDSRLTRQRPVQGPSFTEGPADRKARNKTRRDTVVDKFTNSLAAGLADGLSHRVFGGSKK